MFSDSLLEFKILQVEDGQMEDGFYRLKGIWYKYYSQGYISMQCAVKTNLTETGSWSRPECIVTESSPRLSEMRWSQY